MFGRLVAALPALRRLLEDCAAAEEDGLYRFYHQSFKVYALQDCTRRMTEALQELAPDRPLHASFVAIVRSGTGLNFESEHNAHWMEITRPILEAYQHAKFFLEMAVKYGSELERPPNLLPSGWAAVLHLYGLR